MGQPHDHAPDDEPTVPDPADGPGPADEPDPADEPTAPIPVRWTGSAPVPEPAARRRREGVLREHTRELPTLDDDGDGDEPWPPPPPPRPANAPVTAPYPPPGPPLPARPGPPVHTRPARARTAARPPGYGGRPAYPPPYPPPRYRRRRRWPWGITVLAALTVACCGCCWAWIHPYATQYPATAVLPPQAAGLVKVDDAAAKRTAAELELKVRSQHWLADQTFAGVYADPDDRQRRVTVYGATMFVLDPKQELDGTFAELTTQFGLTDARAVPPGPPGGHVRCAGGTDSGRTVAVCAWTDHGSKAVGIFPGRRVGQGADLIGELRAAIISRG